MTFDARRVDVPAIVAKVGVIGYRAEVQEEGFEAAAAASSFGQEARHWRHMFLGSLLFTIPVFLLSMVFKHIPSMSPGLLREVCPPFHSGPPCHSPLQQPASQPALPLPALPQPSIPQPSLPPPSRSTADSLLLVSPQVCPGLSVNVLVNGLLTTPVQFGFGSPFHRGAYAALRRKHFNMDVLVSIGTFAAYASPQPFPTALPQPLPRPFPTALTLLSLPRGRYGYSIVFIVVALATRGAQGADNEQFETAAMLITFILLGKYLETAAKGRASNAITQLLTLQPPTALQVRIRAPAVLETVARPL